MSLLQCSFFSMVICFQITNFISKRSTASFKSSITKTALLTQLLRIHKLQLLSFKETSIWLYCLRTDYSLKTNSISAPKLHYCCCSLLDSNPQVLYLIYEATLLLNRLEHVLESLDRKKIFLACYLLYACFSLLQLKAQYNLELKLHSRWCNYGMRVSRWLQSCAFHKFIKTTVKLQQAGKTGNASNVSLIVIIPPQTMLVIAIKMKQQGKSGSGNHSFSSGFWGSIILTCVNGKSPFRPLTSPSHWPFIFILVTFTISPTCIIEKSVIIIHGNIIQA